MNTSQSKNHSYIADFDRAVFFSYLVLCMIGLGVLLDISSVRENMNYFYKQLMYLVPALLIMFSALYFPNLQKLQKYNWVWIGTVLFLLIAVLAFGVEVNGARRFLKLGPFLFQPSFLARVALVFSCAGLLARKQDEINEKNISKLFQTLLPFLIIVLVIFILILKEKHLSTIVISALTLFGMFWIGGIRKRFFVAIMIIGLLGVLFIITKGSTYRGERIEIYKKYSLFTKEHVAKVNPEKEYQTRESLTALSSGKLLGTGIDRGRAKHFFLPESRTDYVFTIIGEETGFAGALFVFGLQCFLFWRAFKLSWRQEDTYLRYLGIGLALNLFLNVLVNVGVAMSAIPSTGVTLPFISYGGTSLLVDSLAIGLLLNISAKRKEI
jgi:cell division protein FtsW (lipid II flippase)